MPNGGKLTIETANCYLDQAYVAPLSEPVEPGQYVMIAVTDTGVGMDRATRRTGVRSVLHHQGGRQGHRSRPEPGLRLRPPDRRPRQDLQRSRRRHDGEDLSPPPCRRGGQRRNVDIARRTTARAIGAETILVVEDDEALRSYTTEILSELGYACWRRTTARARSRCSRTNQVDLLFTDVVMPGGMNGRQLADEATRRRPGPEGAVHHRLHAQRHRASRPARRRRAHDRQAVLVRRSGAKVRALLDD